MHRFLGIDVWGMTRVFFVLGVALTGALGSGSHEYVRT